MNSKVTWMAFVEDHSQAETMKCMFDEINTGTPAVFPRKGTINPENIISLQIKNNFIADDIMLVRRKIVNDFLSDIGINNSNLDKRERLNEQEVNANNEEIRFNILNWVDNINEGLDVANKLYELNLKLNIREVTTNAEKTDKLIDMVNNDEFTKSD